MQTAFSVALFILAIFIFWSSPKEKLNQWCSAAVVFFFFGVVKQAVMFEIFPTIQNSFQVYSLQEKFAPFHNIFTWVIYTLGMPTMAVAGCYFGYIDCDRKHKYLKIMMYIPGALLLVFFSPLKFIEYQIANQPFWITYTLYNLTFGVIIAIVSIRGILIDKKALYSGSIVKKKHNRRKQEAMILLPSLYIWFLSVFPLNLIRVSGLDVLVDFVHIWRFNLVTIIACIIGAIFLAVRGGGFLGIKIVPTHYNNMHGNDFLDNLIHRIKSETSYLNVKIDKMKADLESSQNTDDLNSSMEELSSKMLALHTLSKKVSRYTGSIKLEKESVRLIDMLNEAKRNDIEIIMEINENTWIKCDKNLMIEVFKDIIDNSVQAMQVNDLHEMGIILIIEKLDRNGYMLMFKDNGTGIPLNELDRIFDPGVTTKNKEYNSGMGLANCKKVINSHDGNIYAENNQNPPGATIIIELPSKMVDKERR